LLARRACNLVNVPAPQAAKTILGDILAVKYTVDPGIEGKVAIQTPKPPAPPPPPVAKPAAIPAINADPGVVLAGVMITEGVRKAYLVKKADSQGTWASEGENLMGWKVHSVSATAVKLQQQDRTVELQLYPRQ